MDLIKIYCDHSTDDHLIKTLPHLSKKKKRKENVVKTARQTLFRKTNDNADLPKDFSLFKKSLFCEILQYFFLLCSIFSDLQITSAHLEARVRSDLEEDANKDW